MAVESPFRAAESCGAAENLALAKLLEETADLLESQNDNPFRVKAYRDAALEVRRLERPVRINGFAEPLEASIHARFQGFGNGNGNVYGGFGCNIVYAPRSPDGV